MTKPSPVLLFLMAFVLILVVTFVVYQQNARQKALVRDAELLESGIALFRENKHQEAFELLSGIPEDSIHKWRAQYYQGSSLILLKDFDSAVDYLEQAYALNDREPRIMHALGVAYFKLGNLKMSKAYFAAVLEIDPADKEAKGLMDIMARLERQQSEKVFPGADAEGIELPSDDKVNSH
jgi:tetratricopeptide (TPR) repeat protein